MFRDIKTDYLLFFRNTKADYLSDQGKCQGNRYYGPCKGCQNAKQLFQKLCETATVKQPFLDAGNRESRR